MAALDTLACTWYYGDPNDKDLQAEHIALFAFPEWMQKVFPVYQKITKVTKQWLDKDCAKALEAVFRELVDTGLVKELLSYGGGWNIRTKRGMKEYSIHSWALAVDFNEETNPLGGKVTFSQDFLDVWRKHGFTCGADFGGGRVDGMHFQYTGKVIKAYQAHLEAQKPKPKPAPKPASKPVPAKEVPKPSPVAPLAPKKVELQDFHTPTFLPKTLPKK